MRPTGGFGRLDERGPYELGGSHVTTSVPPQPAEAVDRSFFGQPRGLMTLFLTEMWERFSYYGMRAILVLFLVDTVQNGGLGLSTATAASIYAIYNAMVYMLAIPGGWIADRLWGARRTVLIGAIVIAAGHYVMALPAESTIWIGLAAIAVGTGLLKPNISAMVGALYSETDTRRDAGFSIFYMGINLGAFIAPLITGWLGENVSWHAGFLVAAIGMTLALVQYVLGASTLPESSSRASRPATSDERRRVLRTSLLWLAAAAVLLAIDMSFGWFELDHVINALTVLAVAVPIVYFVVMFRTPGLTHTEISRLRAFIWIFVAATVFWMIYDQAGSLLNIFAQDKVDRDVLGFEFPASWYQSVNPVLILALAPVFAWLWTYLGSRQPSTPVKFGMALWGIALSFVIMALAGAAASDDTLISPLWLLAVYFVQTVAELLLSPTGLSVSTKLAPARFTGQVLGIWFLATATGNALNAQVTKLNGEVSDPVYYGSLAVVAALVGLLIFALAPRMKQLMSGVR